jgi:hypothetical protein
VLRGWGCKKENAWLKEPKGKVVSKWLSEPCLQGRSEFTKGIQVKERGRSKYKDDFSKDSYNNP